MFTKNFKKAHLSKQIIFIVEDNEAYGKSLRAFIQAHFPEIKEIKNFRIGEMCLMELHRNPGIVIVDYFLNSKYEDAHNGLEIIEQIKNLKPNTQIIVLTSQERPGVIIDAIKKYDCGYVQKDENAFKYVKKLIKNILTRKDSAVLQPWE